MDADRFDAVTRALTPGSRRSFLGTLSTVAGSALTSLLARDDAEAHDLLKKCKTIKDKDKKKKCVKKAKAHAAQDAASAAPPPPPPLSQLPQECGTPADCPAPNNPCRVATCSGGRCGVANAAAGTFCDDDLFCNGRETCDGNGNCLPGTPPSCNDGIACTVDACNESTARCTHTPNHSFCGPNQVCNPTAGCVCQPGASCHTGKPGRCAAGTIQCHSGNPVCVQNHGPIAETCNSIDDDCDGVVDEGAICPSAENAQGACVAGICTFTCDSGFDNCDGDASNGCETDLMTDVSNCGECGRNCFNFIRCAAGYSPTCTAGNCECE